MPNQYHEPLIKRLVLAKYLFLQGKQQLNRQTKLSANLALLNFHDAVELLLITIAQSVNIDLKKEMFIVRLAEEINKKKELQKLGLNDLNELRKRLKHYGDMVELEKVQEVSIFVERMFNDNLKSFFDLDLSSLRMSQLIEDVMIREHLTKAEIAFESDYVQVLLTEVALAFSYIKEIVRKSELGIIDKIGDQIRFSRPVRGNQDFLEMLEKPFGEIETRFQDIEELLILLAYQINIRDYLVFKALTPTVQTSLNGTRRLTFTNLSEYQNEWNFTKTNLELLINFVLEASLKVEGNTARLISKFDSPRRSAVIIADKAEIYSSIDNSRTVLTTATKGETFEEDFPIALDFNNEWFMIKLKEKIISNNVEHHSGFIRKRDISFQKM